MLDTPKFPLLLITLGVFSLIFAVLLGEAPGVFRHISMVLWFAGAILIFWAAWDIFVNGVERINYSRADYHAAKREEVEARNAVIPGVTDDFLSQWFSASESVPNPQRRYGEGSRERTMAALIIAELCSRGFATMTANKGAQWEKGWSGSAVALEIGLVPPFPIGEIAQNA